jgi:hypothetical protein
MLIEIRGPMLYPQFDCPERTEILRTRSLPTNSQPTYFLDAVFAALPRHFGAAARHFGNIRQERGKVAV